MTASAASRPSRICASLALAGGLLAGCAQDHLPRHGRVADRRRRRLQRPHRSQRSRREVLDRRHWSSQAARVRSVLSRHGGDCRCGFAGGDPACAGPGHDHRCDRLCTARQCPLRVSGAPDVRPGPTGPAHLTVWAPCPTPRPRRGGELRDDENRVLWQVSSGAYEETTTLTLTGGKSYALKVYDCTPAPAPRYGMGRYVLKAEHM